MVRFGLGNYEDYLLKAIVNSSFAKNGLMTVVTYILTAIIRFHISIIVCILINGTLFTDIIFPVIVSVLLSFSSGNLYRYIETHRCQYERMVDYFIDNYSWSNLMMWKRYLLISILGYILLALLLISIDNYFIFLTTMQAAASFIICDILENRAAILRKFKTWWYQPTVTFIPPSASRKNNSIRLIETPVPVRASSIDEIAQLRVSPVPLKPKTPPTLNPNIIPPRPRTPPSIYSKIIPIPEYESSDDDSTRQIMDSLSYDSD